MQILLKLLHDLGWIAPALLALAVASGWGGWRGRPIAPLILPVGAALLNLATIGQLQSLSPELAPDVWSSRLYALINREFAGLFCAGAAALLLLPSMRGVMRSRSVLAAALLGVLWPPLSHLPDFAGQGRTSPGSVALCMGLAGALLYRRADSGSSPLVGPAAYASFSAVVASAAASGAFIVGFDELGGPDGRCDQMRAILLRGTVAMTLAIGSTLIASVPLWVTARRIGKPRWAASFTRILVLCCIGLSPLSSMNFVSFGPRSSCAPSPYAVIDVGLVAEPSTQEPGPPFHAQ